MENIISDDFRDEILFLTKKTKLSLEEIIVSCGVQKYDDKFLYNSDTIVILLDYSNQIIDRWKNQVVLHCHGDKTYKSEEDACNLSKIEQKFFNLKYGEIKVYIFWKKCEGGDYDFINGLFVMQDKPYLDKENGTYRWVFPLIYTDVDGCGFRMSVFEKYAFNFKKSEIEKIYNRNNAENEVFSTKLNDTLYVDQSSEKPSYRRTPKNKNVSYKEVKQIIRNNNVVINALRIADFECELGKEHTTFLRKKHDINYTEAHHLVPLAFYELFESELDTEENVVSLCCVCHKKIHYGKDAGEMIKTLYNKRKELLKDVGIIIEEHELLQMYGVCE